MKEVLESTKFVVENSKNVSINHAKIEEFCETFTEKKIKHWWNEAPFKIDKLDDEKKLMFLVVMDSISFSYGGNPKWTFRYKGKDLSSGAFGLISAIGKAYEDKKQIFDADYLSKVVKRDLAEILRANTLIPLLDERLKILNQLGKILVSKFNGKFGNLVKTSNDDAVLLVKILVKNFPFFEDSAKYHGRTIYFYKRAQLLVADIFHVFNGKGYGKLKNIDKLTACADYKLPQTLRKLGILEYSKNLQKTIDNKIPIKSGSEEEVEIRANTIWAVEYIKQKLNLTSNEINDYLWLEGVKIPTSDKPYHLTRTTSY